MNVMYVSSCEIMHINTKLTEGHFAVVTHGYSGAKLPASESQACFC